MEHKSRQRIDPNQTALLVIDMQNDFLLPDAPKEIPNGRALLPQLGRVIAAFREAGAPIVYTVHAHRANGSDLGLYGSRDRRIRERACLVQGEPGAEVDRDIAPESGDVVITKRRYSAFFGTDLDIVLRSRGVRTVVVSGITTENCCHATARDAMYRDYEVILLSDATATRDLPDEGYGAISAEELQRTMLVVLGRSTASILSVDDLLSTMG